MRAEGHNEPADLLLAASPGTLWEAFQATAAKHPDVVALRTVGDTVTITWRQYRQRVQAIASGLAKLGVELATPSR